MARTRREWSDMRDEIRRHLRETDSSLSFWSDNNLLDFANLVKDQMEMQLQEAHEGYSNVRFTSDLVNGQTAYSLPEHASRVLRVMIVSSDGLTETPLLRMERLGEATSQGSSFGGDGYLPTYRIVDNQVFLEPAPPENRTDGFVVEIEAATARFVDDADKLPDSWPPTAESLFVMATVVMALDHEGAQSPLPQGLYSSYIRQRDSFEDQWLNYIATRSFGRTYTVPFEQGA